MKTTTHVNPSRVKAHQPPAPKPKPAFEVCCDDSTVAAAVQTRIDAHLAKAVSAPKIPPGTLCACTDLRCCRSHCYNPATELMYDGPGKHAGAALCVKCASWGERGS